jgi:hypothetical protein
MDAHYELFSVADPIFYDDPAAAGRPDDRYAASLRTVPDGWSRVEQGPWVNMFPLGAPFPEQGWKVHMSSALAVTERTIDKVWDFCVAEGVAFKFLRGRDIALMLNTKYADRHSSGKMVTIYPADQRILRHVLDELGGRLAGTPGPYVLSDFRWGEGPLYLRFGSFVERYCRDSDGTLVHAIRGPGDELIPDERGALFAVPDWAPVPDFIAARIAEAQRREEQEPDDFPFTVKEALHFSNGGGVYLATDERDGRQVVLREARPYAGLDYEGHDAVYRLLRERDTLQSLADLDCVPQLYEYRKSWEHHFLVEEHIEGSPLEQVFSQRYVLISNQPTAADVEEYTSWALDVVAQLESVLNQLHDRSVVFGDLHPGNIMVRPDNRVALVDFEIAFPLGRTAPAFGAPGFVSAGARSGVAVDDFALAAMRLHLFLPLLVLLELDSTKATMIADVIGSRFPLPAGYAEHSLALLRQATGGVLPRGSTEPGTSHHSLSWPTGGIHDPRWPETLASLAAGIYATATPQRSDRLFPGDVAQFRGMGGLDLAHGAAGVLFALATTGHEVRQEHVQWLLNRLHQVDEPRFGLYDGLHGIAWALQHLGYPTHADEILARTTTADDDVTTVDLASGLSGIALNLLHFADLRNDDALADRAERMAQRIRQVMTQSVPEKSRLPRPKLPGLMRGASGPALLFLRMFEHTGQRAWLDAATDALHTDLATGKRVDGILHLPDNNNRALPYLGDGTIGLALVAREYLRHRPDPHLTDALTAADKACDVEFLYAPGLFEGRAGMIHYLAARALDSTGPAPHVLDHQLNRLHWHAVPHQGHPAFPGRRLFRLSTDLDTGSAGILLALHSALHSTGGLPFLNVRGNPATANRPIP